LKPGLANAEMFGIVFYMHDEETTTVMVKAATRDRLKRMADQRGMKMYALIDQLVKQAEIRERRKLKGVK
jgi:hypothetical protein